MPGMVTTNSDELAERARMLRQHGMRRRYYHDEVGWNARHGRVPGRHPAGQAQVHRRVEPGPPAQWQSAMTRSSRPRVWPRRALPRATASFCRTRSRAARHVWHQYVIRTARRDELREFPCRRKIGSEIYYPVPLHLQEALKSLGYARRRAFPRPSAPPAKCWRCPSFLNCAKTSSRPSSAPSRSS